MAFGQTQKKADRWHGLTAPGPPRGCAARVRARTVATNLLATPSLVGLSGLHVQPPTSPPFAISCAGKVHSVSPRSGPDLPNAEFVSDLARARVQARHQGTLIEPWVSDEES